MKGHASYLSFLSNEPSYFSEQKNDFGETKHADMWPTHEDVLMSRVKCCPSNQPGLDCSLPFGGQIHSESV
jgi:hypothetical protein